MVVTRSTTSSPTKPSRSTTTAVNTTQIEKSTATTPLRLVVLPEDISPDARFIAVSDPSDGDKRKQFLFCPLQGLHELTIISAPKHQLRSALLSLTEAPNDEHVDTEHPKRNENGYILQHASYTTVTPYDPCFLLLPLVTDNVKGNLMRSLDDLCEDVEDGMQQILQRGRETVMNAMERICDAVEVGDEKMYRYNSKKTLRHILNKAERLCQKGLPPSMKDKLVARALEAPVLSIRREESAISVTSRETQHTSATTGGLSVEVDESFDSQSTSTATIAASLGSSGLSTADTSATTLTNPTTENTAPTQIVHLQTLLTAFKFIAYSYLKPSLAASLITDLQNPAISNVDFAPLTKHLADLAELRKEAAASMSMNDYSRKRDFEDDEEAAERAEKKKKVQEEEKRKKASMSRGVKDLAKVNVAGMKKMSDFFGRKPVLANKGKT